jgi:hypothetical protein
MPPSKARFRATWILLFAAYIILIASAALIGILKMEKEPDGGRDARPAPAGRTNDPAAQPTPGAQPEARPAEGGGAAQVHPREAGELVLSLRLVDASSEEPITGVRAGITLRSTSRTDAREAVTDGEGLAEVPGVAPGRSSIEIQVAGFLPARQAIDLGGERARVEVRLTRGASLEGDVLGPAGEPLAGARIRAFRLEAEGPEGASATAGSDGAFALRGLRDGSWRVTAVKEGFRARSVEAPLPGERLRIVLVEDPGFDVIVLGPDGSPVAGARVSIVSRTGGASAGSRSGETGSAGRVHLAGLPSDPGTELALEARHRDHVPARLTRKGADLEREPLTIRFAKGGEVAGRVVNLEGAPVPNAEVTLTAVGERSTKSLKTTSSGEFVFRKAPAGSYDLAASSSRDGSGALRGISVTEGGAARDLVVKLEPGDGVIAGRVVDRAGKGVVLSPVEVILEGVSGVAHRTMSGDGGAFRLEGLPAPGEGGAYRLKAGGGKLSTVEVGGIRSGEEAVELVVERLGSIKGLIESPEPVDGYSIRATRTVTDGGKPFERTFRFTSRDLWFHLRGLSPGTYDLTLLVGREARAAVQGVTVTAGAETGPVEMRL